MTNQRIGSVINTDMTNKVPNLSIDPAEQDSPGVKYVPEWAKWYGYYKVIPELQAVVDKKALWTIGRGFTADDATKKKLDKIRGCGKDSFDQLLYNLCRSYTIGGDAFAEIIETKRGELRNLKPLNPGYIEIQSSDKGIIKKYAQLGTDGKTKLNSWKPDEMLHLAWNRLGDECHGHSTVEKLEQIILMRNEAMTDMKTVFHRYVKPLLITEADTDDPAEIAALKVKLDSATANGENMIIPKGTVSVERVSIPQYSTLDPLPWIRCLNDYFIMAEGVPEVILGLGRDTTEATAKTLYLAFQQVVEHNQLFIEQALMSQLKLKINLTFPASLEMQMQQQQAKAHKGMNTGTGGANDRSGKSSSGDSPASD